MAALEDDARYQEDSPPQSLKIPQAPASLPLPTVPASELPPFQIPGMGAPGGITQLLQSIPQLQNPAPPVPPKLAGGGGGIGLSLPSLGLPPPPAPRQMPTPPKAKYSDPLDTLGNPLTALALIASAFVRKPATTAMKALANAAKAQKEGDQVKYQNDYREYEQALQKAHAEQQQEQADYKRDYDNRRLSIQERSAKMRGTATRRGDSAMLSFLDSGGDPGTLLDDRAKAGLPISAALEKTAAIKKIMKENPGLSYADAQAKFTTDKARKALEAKTGTGQPGDPALHGEAYLATLPPGMSDQVRAIAEGRAPLPQGRWGQQLREMAFHYNPELRGQTYTGRAAAERNFASGPAAQNVTALNTVMGHMERLQKSAADLNNSGWRTANKALNAYAEETGDPRVVPFLADAHAVAAELGRVFKGTVTNREIEDNMKLIDASRSPTQLRGIIKEFGELIASRVEAMHNQQERTTGRSEDLLSPHARESFDTIRGGAKPSSGGATLEDIWK